MGRGTAWKAHDVDVVRGWMAAGKTTTAMATLRPDWSRSSIKKLVARLRAPGGGVGVVYTRKFIRLNKPHNEELLAVPASSPDLNVCDYYLWKAIQDRLQPRYGTRVELRADILRQTLSLPLEEIRRAICSWPHRLLQCRMAGGGHFEG